MLVANCHFKKCKKDATTKQKYVRIAHMQTKLAVSSFPPQTPSPVRNGDFILLYTKPLCINYEPLPNKSPIIGHLESICTNS